MKTPTINITLLSCVLVICAHNAPVKGGLRYTAYMMDGMNRVISHHFAKQQPVVREKTLVMDDTEIHLHDGAVLLVEHFLKSTQEYVNAPRQLPVFSALNERAIA